MKDWQALSRRQGLTADAPPPRHVVIVSRTGSLRAALRQVECLRQEGRATWLIAHGASLIELPPADAGVLQTELGAFVSPDYLQASKPLRAELRGWLEDFFGPTGKDLCGSAAIRFLQHLIEMSYFLPQLQAMAQGREVFFFDRAGFVAEGLCRPGPAGPTWVNCT